MIELFSFKKLKDFGVDYNFALLKTEICSVVQISIGYYDEYSWPYLQIHMGGNQLFSFLCYFWKLSFAIDILGRTWPD